MWAIYVHQLYYFLTAAFLFSACNKGWVEIPYDLVPVNESDTKKKDFISNRTEYLKLFDTRRQKVYKDGKTKATETTLLTFRKLVGKLADTALDAHFAKVTAEKYPDLRYGPDKKRIERVKDVLKVYPEIKDEQKRLEFGSWSVVGAWGNNEPTIDIVHDVTDTMEWVIGNTSVNGDERQRRTDGGTLRTIVVNKKRSKLDPIESLIIRKDRVSFRLREKKITTAQWMTLTSEDKVAGLVCMKRASFSNNYFNGWIGYHYDHPTAMASIKEEIAKEKAEVEKQKGKPEEQQDKALLKRVELNDFLAEMTKRSHNIGSVKKLISVMKKRFPEDFPIVSFDEAVGKVFSDEDDVSLISALSASVSLIFGEMIV